VRPWFAFLGLAACTLLGVNALLIRFAIEPTARVALPVVALALLGAGFAAWRRGV
jgi:hypothetical protein